MPGSGGITLFHIRGIRVGVDYSWFLLLFLIIFWMSGIYRDVLGLREKWSYAPVAVGFDLGADLIVEAVAPDADDDDRSLVGRFVGCSFAVDDIACAELCNSVADADTGIVLNNRLARKSLTLFASCNLYAVTPDGLAWK